MNRSEVSRCDLEAVAAGGVASHGGVQDPVAPGQRGVHRLKGIGYYEFQFSGAAVSLPVSSAG